MKRNSALKVLNPILGVLLVSQIATGLFGASIPYETFETVHEGGGILLGVVVVLHVILNWNWIRASYFRKGSAAGE